MTGLLRLFAVVAASLGLGGVPANPHVHGVVSIRIGSSVGITNVTDARDVRQIVTWFNALPRFQTPSCSTPLAIPPNVKFVFRDAAGHTLLSITDHEPGVCGSWISYELKGQVGSVALAEDDFAGKVSGLLTVDFDANAQKTAANKRAALSDAATLLHLLVLPPGSRRVTKPPSKYLTGVVTGERNGMWITPLPFESVVAFEDAHRPKGATEPESGYGALYSTITSKYVVFSLPPRRGIPDREIWLYMAPLPDGSTGIRAEAESSWVIARASGEYVPASVRTIEIKKDSGNGLLFPVDSHSAPKEHSRLVHRVTAPRQVAKIVRWFNRLPIFPRSGYIPCFGMPPSGPSETIVFLDGSGHELGRADNPYYAGDGGECYPMTYSAGGHDYTPLISGNFLSRVERLLR